MPLGAGTPIDQLCLTGEEWQIHADVVGRALRTHQQELGWIVGPDVKLSYSKQNDGYEQDEEGGLWRPTM